MTTREEILQPTKILILLAVLLAVYLPASAQHNLGLNNNRATRLQGDDLGIPTKIRSRTFRPRSVRSPAAQHCLHCAR